MDGRIRNPTILGKKWDETGDPLVTCGRGDCRVCILTRGSVTRALRHFGHGAALRRIVVISGDKLKILALCTYKDYWIQAAKEILITLLSHCQSDKPSINEYGTQIVNIVDRTKALYKMQVMFIILRGCWLVPTIRYQSSSLDSGYYKSSHTLASILCTLRLIPSSILIFTFSKRFRKIIYNS